MDIKKIESAMLSLSVDELKKWYIDNGLLPVNGRTEGLGRCCALPCVRDKLGESHNGDEGRLWGPFTCGFDFGFNAFHSLIYKENLVYQHAHKLGVAMREALPELEKKICTHLNK